jgi:hypothetical protein
VKLVGEGSGSTTLKGFIQADSEVEITALTLAGNYADQNNIICHMKGSKNVFNFHDDVVFKDGGFCAIINDIGTDVTGKLSFVKFLHCGDFGFQFRRGAHDLTITDVSGSDFASRVYPGHLFYLDDVDGAYAARISGDNLPKTPNNNDISLIKVTREGDTPNKGILIEDVTARNACAVATFPGAKNVTLRRASGVNISLRGYYLGSGGDNVVLDTCSVDTAPIGFTSWGALPTNSKIINGKALNCTTKCNISKTAIAQTNCNW